eukprot:1476906-Prymnesium_polylepis.1
MGMTKLLTLSEILELAKLHVDDNGAVQQSSSDAPFDRLRLCHIQMDVGCVHYVVCALAYMPPCSTALVPSNGDKPLPFTLEPNDLLGREPANKKGRSLFDFDNELAKYKNGRSIRDCAILEFLEGGKRRFTHPDPIPMKQLDWAGLKGRFAGDLTYGASLLGWTGDSWEDDQFEPVLSWLGLKDLKYYALLLGYDATIWPGPQASDEEICAEIEYIEGLGESAHAQKISLYANLRGAVILPQRVFDMKAQVLARKQQADRNVADIRDCIAACFTSRLTKPRKWLLLLASIVLASTRSARLWAAAICRTRPSGRRLVVRRAFRCRPRHARPRESD